MNRTSVTYGKRGRLNETNSGIRQTAPTFGKAKHGTFMEKAGGHITVESDGEMFAARLLSIDPRVSSFQPQPFTVDLIDQRLLLTTEARSTAWRRHYRAEGPKFYTPDFSVVHMDGLRYSLEVKAEGFEGDELYQEKIELARPVLAANNYPLRTVVFPKNTAHPIRLNAHLLKQAAQQIHTYFDEDLVERVCQRCGDEPTTMLQLCKDLQLMPGLIPILLVKGVLSADLARFQIKGALPLTLGFGDLNHLCLIEEVVQ
nr:hypothetical protein [Herbaspirillum sp. ASV7]